MNAFKKSVVTINVLLSSFLTIAAQSTLGSNLIVIKQNIEVTTPILADKPESGYQYFFRFAELGNGPECNLHIVSESEPINFPAGAILHSTKGIEVNPNPSQHPADFSKNRSVRIDADKTGDVTFTIQCSDSKSFFSFKSLKEFNKEDINEFTLPYIEIQ